jgi:hypothetical protein
MAQRTLMCPSAQPELAHSSIYGVIGGPQGKVDVVYLPEELPITSDLIALCAPVTPAEVFRIAAPCQGKKCQHFDGAECRLVNSLVQIAPSTNSLKQCAIRPSCRWYAQQGSRACVQCSAIVTTYYNPPAELDAAAIPFRQKTS